MRASDKVKHFNRFEAEPWEKVKHLMAKEELVGV